MNTLSTLTTALDVLYKKDIQGFRIERGTTKEIRYPIPYASNVVVRISATAPVIIAMAGPHIEQSEVVGTKEYKFTAGPGSEFLIKFQGKEGFFVKPSDVTLEVELYTARDALRISEELKNLLEVLKELGKDYYDLNKEHIQDVLKRMVSVWNLLDEDTKSKARELMTLAKKFETGQA